MSMLYVCPLSDMFETVKTSGARHLVTLMYETTHVKRPEIVSENNHLILKFHDLSEPREDHTLPDETHIRAFLDFVEAWDRTSPLVIHCFAGVSRSTAAGYIAACALMPEKDETEIANDVRRLSPTATPNARMIALADGILGREGRMIEAINALGRGKECHQGVPFNFEIVTA